MVFCTVDQTPGSGGIARVSVLIGHVLECRTISLLPPGAGHVTVADKIRFCSAVAQGQLRGEFDSLFFDHIGPASIQALIPRSRRKPYGVFLHGIEIWRHLGPLSKQALLQADVRIANSAFTAEKTRSAHPDIGPIEVCALALPPDSSTGPDGIVDRDVMQRIRPQSALIVGRLAASERYKGHDQLIACWHSVTERVPEAQLVIVGTGDDLERLRDESRKAGCQDSILFAGWVNEATLAAVYDAVAIYAMPGDGEGFGLVFLEAMNHRLPCVASTTDASREIVVDGETGFLTNPRDLTKLARCLTDLLSDLPLRQRFGNAGYARLHAQYTFGRFRDRFRAAVSPLN